MQQALTNESRETASTPERAYVRLLTPDHRYFQNEPITVLIYPPNANEYQLQIRQLDGQPDRIESLLENRLLLSKGLTLGHYRLRARWRGGADITPGNWSDWSLPCEIHVHRQEDHIQVQRLRAWEHRMSLIVDHDTAGVPVVIDPTAMPPSYPQGELTCWFRTPIYEGAPTLLNGPTEYYKDPQAYFLECMEKLIDRNVEFLTWHDVLDGNVGSNNNAVILQFDMDGGPHSLNRLLDEMLEMNLRASIMIHRERHDWYEYNIEDFDLEKLKQAQDAGWCIGYHNNALGNCQRLDQLGNYGSPIMMKASSRFLDDVNYLKEIFDIRTYTNHGGNVLNHKLDPPPQADVVCVDRTNTRLWQPIGSMFSDGGFAARPGPLHERIETEKPGIHFFRIHPVKYANFSQPWDFPPLVLEDALVHGSESTPQLKSWISSEIKKQEAWLQHREQYRLGKRITNASANKPLSNEFMSLLQVPQIAEHYKQRQQFFVREYPAIDGDPRVFWWRLLHAFGPKAGEVLNVGALPPDRRSETTDFLSEKISVIEMDIDQKRKPHILGDVTEPPEENFNQFAAVLLFGLGCVHSPSKAVEACFKLAAPDGMGLFGFPDDTHPLRGEMWQPECRFNWKPGREPLHDIGIQQNLWSFDPQCLEELFGVWPEVTIENFSHYWFVICNKS